MKKKIVNVILSVAVVTSMMFTVTACGSKDNDKAPAESAAVTNTVEDTAKADTTDNKDSESGSMSAEDWISSTEASEYVELINTTMGSITNGMMTIGFEAEGSTLSIVFTVSEEMFKTDGSDLTDEEKEEMETQMQQQYDANKANFEPIRDVLKESIGDPNLVVRIVYRTSNGTELFSQDL